MNCQSVRENLWAYSHRQIPDEVASSVRSHMESCAACTAELEQFMAVDRALDGFEPLEPSPYFDQKLNARLSEIERTSSGWGWVSMWLRDRYLWTFATLFLAVTGLWLAFRHQQNLQLKSMEEVVRLQDENLSPERSPSTPSDSARKGEIAAVPEKSRAISATEDVIPDEDLAVVENFELLQDYDFLKDLADTRASNRGAVKAN